MRTFGSLALALTLCLGPQLGRADFQEIMPKTGQQNSLEIDTGANGICETTATPDDVQVIPVGTAPAFQAEIKCGPNKTVDTNRSW